MLPVQTSPRAPSCGFSETPRPHSATTPRGRHPSLDRMTSSVRLGLVERRAIPLNEVERSTRGSPLQFQSLVSPRNRETDRRAQVTRQLRRQVLLDGPGQSGDWSRLVGWRAREKLWWWALKRVGIFVPCSIRPWTFSSPPEAVGCDRWTRLSTGSSARVAAGESSCFIWHWPNQFALAAPRCA